MNVLYTKAKRTSFQKVSQDSVDSFSTYTRSSSKLDGVHVSGDGDFIRCCRLCGGDNSLKYFRDTYVWEGVEERYDQLLYDCFGVKVTSSDCMICDWCVRALRGTEKFRALVHAAFDGTTSGSNMALETDASSTLVTIRTNSCQTTNIVSKECSKMKHEQLMINKKVDTQRKREVKKHNELQNTMNKRTIVNCDLCNQRYPMIISSNFNKGFTCSRCKKNGEVRNVICRKCNIQMPGSMLKTHMELHVKADIRAKTRLRQLTTSRTKVVLVPKLNSQLTRGSKKLTTNRPAEHLKNIHGDNYKCAPERDEDGKHKLAEDDMIMFISSDPSEESHFGK